MLLLPPAVATLAAWGEWRMNGGEAACIRGLGLDTPGLACEEGVLVLLTELLIGGFHLLIVLPALLWIVRHDRGRTDRPMARRVEAGAAALTLVLWMSCLADALLHARGAVTLCRRPRS